VHPTLVTLGPWTAAQIPLVFLFFLVVVGVWTYFERRDREVELRLTPALVAEVVIQAAIPTVIAWLLVNRLGPLHVRSYGVMMLVAFVAGLSWMYLDRARYGFTGPQVLQAGLLGFAGGIIGGRLGYVLLNLEDYMGQPGAAFDLWRGGMSWHGGVAGGMLVLLVATRFMGVSFARVFDLAAPGVAVGYALARIGCFLNGCCYGHACDLPWAVTFPQLSSTSAPPVPVHPTQLYSVAGTLLFTLPVLLWTTRWLQKPFSRFLGFLVLSSIVRIVVEFFRRGATGEIYAPLPALTVAQAASIAIILVAGAAIVIREGGNWRVGSPQN
jgi:phosphatidylglycerol:prolipoprotein diacylglycerol transferase